MKTHAWLLVILTILLGIVGGLFSVPGFNDIIKHPQFGDLQPITDVITEIRKAGNGHWYSSAILWYRCFFILDLIWAACLLSYLYRRVRNHTTWLAENPFKVKGLSRLLFISVVAAYFFDVSENITYLSLLGNAEGTHLSTIADLKVFCYAIVFLLVLVFLYQEYVFERLHDIKSAVKASFFSILTILLLVILATLMDQGSTVIIHLLDSPWSLGATIVLINLLSLASAHYPDYLEKYFKADYDPHAEPDVHWDIQGIIGKNPFWGMGLITYKPISTQTAANSYSAFAKRQTREKESLFFDHFRKITGLMVIMTWIYVLLYVIAKYKVPQLPLMTTMLCFLILFLILYFICYHARQYWRRHVTNNLEKTALVKTITRNNSSGPAERMMMPSKVRFYLKATLITFILLLLSIGSTIWVSSKGHWIQTWIAVMVTTCINAVFIILFQHFRTVFSAAGYFRYFRWVPVFYLNNDISYVRFFAIMGFVSLLIFIGFTPDPSQLNALVLILLYVYLMYGFIVILLKHHLYYSQKDKNGQSIVPYSTARVFFEKYVPILGLILIVWIFYTGKAGNGLHTLHPLAEKETNLVTIEAYKNKLRASYHSTEGDTLNMVASYGGGLRATAWTMLLLDTLQKSKEGFFEKTAAMSGVSGGFLGLSMYASILAEYDTIHYRMEIIDNIGKHNILSIDISYLLGFDFLREMIPYRDSFYFKDRAGRSMKEYASLIQPKKEARIKLLTTGYRQYWSSLFMHEPKKFFPALIGNSTATHSRYGVTFSLQSLSNNEKSSFDTIFPGGIDMLELDSNVSISYLDATSTVERFPIFSPTAQINKKGHFLDGGYFENSGLLSLLNFYEYLKKDTTLHLRDSTTKIIVFINSKEAYIRYVLGDTVTLKDELATGEMGAILNTVTDVNILPLALEAKYKLQFGKNFIPVYLPYTITYDDVMALIRGTPAEPLVIQKRINASNQKIEKLLTPYRERNIYPVPPALARVLSEPAYIYIKAMLKHDEVVAALHQI